MDECIVGREVDLALRIANMANTFHKSYVSVYFGKLFMLYSLQVSEIVDNRQNAECKDDVASGTTASDSKASERELKHYIQSENIIRRHVIWRLPGFWEDALLEGVKNQLNHMEPVLWDELDEDTVRGSVTGSYRMYRSI